MSKRKSKRTEMQNRIASFKWRGGFLFACFFVMCAGLVGRAFYLQVLHHDFYAGQADARHVRNVKISSHRGQITDRNGELIAVSTPVDSVWVDPQTIMQAQVNYTALAKALGRSEEWVSRRISQNSSKEFIYLRRHMRPDLAEQIKALNIPGLYLQREYRRYYPAGEVTAHLLGFTGIDDVGQEGLELAYDHRLQGKSGLKQVLRDRLGRSIDDFALLKKPHSGEVLETSIDLRLQYLAYRELKTAVQKYNATSGSLVVLDVHTGEVLAMVNQPSYNPNNRGDSPISHYRNRAVTDLFEPGSGIKPLIASAAVEAKTYSQDSIVNTSPGYFKIGARVIKDDYNLGKIDLSTVISRSSNVGIARVALGLEPQKMWQVLSGFGLGQLTYSNFPGESAGLLNHYTSWRPSSQASMAYGYGLSVTPLQMAHAYAVIGNQGIRTPVSFLKRERADAAKLGEQIISQDTARQAISMMEKVVQDGGTGPQARIEGYRVAGKTGTAWKFIDGAYSQERYRSSFIGLAPASNPKVAVVVIVDDPRGDKYYGGDVAAPVFSNTLAGALRLLNIKPDGFANAEPGAMQVKRQLSSHFAAKRVAP